MDNDKERQEISLIGRIFSLEMLLIVMGFFSIASGIYYAKVMQMFWGAVIIAGSLMILLLRKRFFRKR